MLNKILFILLCILSSNIWAINLDELKLQYNNFSQETKQMFKDSLKDDGWLSLSTSFDSEMYYNPNYIKYKSSDVATVWLKDVITNDSVKDGMTIGDYKMQQVEYDCRNETVTLLQTNTYNGKSGKVIKSSIYPNYSRKVHSIIPESVGASQLKTICFIHHVKFKQ